MTYGSQYEQYLQIQPLLRSHSPEGQAARIAFKSGFRYPAVYHGYTYWLNVVCCEHESENGFCHCCYEGYVDPDEQRYVNLVKGVAQQLHESLGAQ